MGYAVAGALHDPDVEPAGVLIFLVAVLLAHDLIWMPAVLATGALLARHVPRRHRPAVITAILCAVSVTVVALPLVLGFGRPPDNPSALPLPYPRNLLAVLLALAVAAVLRRWWVANRKDSERPGEPGGRSGDV
ncbi:hypothetical protein [Actinoplanes subglobosus]|uniref:Uncharacterized protein n=1 Tax=Actinoplanes subglobosus TaxID=1547892 RepID=A0ABV8ISI0_9ACTN